ncbi:hypothetical protein SAMN05444156_2183 [Verrucomicrobium sp. GAS474]|uniref:hypothetical protein n=1 Tax=Verrucomicrobium sp. GAS474 TaxID=1882831 RepID=UPI0008793DE8|nr:hypothetical protein [Verrucomicrobium sp. GAS474]SDU13770.1 hypothetical protein SAMN05444156_2183 [Verrucomicrobium sp. GAS474]
MDTDSVIISCIAGAVGLFFFICYALRYLFPGEAAFIARTSFSWWWKMRNDPGIRWIVYTGDQWEYDRRARAKAARALTRYERKLTDRLTLMKAQIETATDYQKEFFEPRIISTERHLQITKTALSDMNRNYDEKLTSEYVEQRNLQQIETLKRQLQFEKTRADELQEAKRDREKAESERTTKKWSVLFAAIKAHDEAGHQSPLPCPICTPGQLSYAYGENREGKRMIKYFGCTSHCGEARFS